MQTTSRDTSAFSESQELLLRHGRACPGHPRLFSQNQDVDARHKAGHDEGEIDPSQLETNPQEITMPPKYRYLAGLAALLLCATAAQAEDKVTYQLGWIPTGEYAPYFAGVQKGFYREEGIDLVMSRGFGSGDTVKKVAGGGAMFGEADISTVMLAAIREKAQVKCLMSEYTQSPHSVFVLESSGIKSLKDL